MTTNPNIADLHSWRRAAFVCAEIIRGFVLGTFAVGTPAFLIWWLR
jgi:hypothetical protein